MDNSMGNTNIFSMLPLATLLYKIAVPSKPNISGVSRINGEPHKLLVTWSAPETPNGVIINYYIYCNNSDSVETTTVCGCQLAAVVMNLIPFTYYDCKVSATTSAGEGESSSKKSAQTEESGQSIAMCINFMLATAANCLCYNI